MHTKRGKEIMAYPDVEIKILVGNRLNIETDSWNGSDNFANLEPMVSEDRREWLRR